MSWVFPTHVQRHSPDDSYETDHGLFQAFLPVLVPEENQSTIFVENWKSVPLSGSKTIRLNVINWQWGWVRCRPGAGTRGRGDAGRPLCGRVAAADAHGFAGGARVAVDRQSEASDVRPLPGVNESNIY